VAVYVCGECGHRGHWWSTRDGVKLAYLRCEACDSAEVELVDEVPAEPERAGRVW